MKIEEIGAGPRLAKMETSIQSVAAGVQPVQPIQDMVDLSGETMRVIKDLSSENPPPGEV
jgi:hypothetical protein